MKIINLSEGNSLLNQYVAELRDIHVQNDRMRFRRNIEKNRRNHGIRDE